MSYSEQDLWNGKVMHPAYFVRRGWPNVRLAPHQWQILMSLYESPLPYSETIVPAGNMLGKDFIAALACIWWLCSRRPARVVNTSANDRQLEDVLWGEIRRLLREWVGPALPIQYNHKHIRVKDSNGEFIPLCEMVGHVANKGESLLGRHLPKDVPRTLVLIDESSGVDTVTYQSCRTWAHHVVAVGNPFPCENFFRDMIKDGEIVSDGKYRRRIIHVRAEDSPNVQLGIEQIKRGERKPEPILIKTDKQYWGVYTQAQYDWLLKRWNDKQAQEHAA